MKTKVIVKLSTGNEYLRKILIELRALNDLIMEGDVGALARMDDLREIHDTFTRELIDRLRKLATKRAEEAQKVAEARRAHE